MTQDTKDVRALGQLLWDSPRFPLTVQEAATVASDISSHSYTRIREGASTESLLQMKKNIPRSLHRFPFPHRGPGRSPNGVLQPITGKDRN